MIFNKDTKLHNEERIVPSTNGAKKTGYPTNRVKRQPTEWKKMYTNHISDKGLISTIHKELL